MFEPNPKRFKSNVSQTPNWTMMNTLMQTDVRFTSSIMNLTELINIVLQTPKHSKVLQDFYKKLQDSGKGKLLALHRTSLQNPNLEYVKLLAELGHEQMFDVTYVDIEEKTSSGEEQCLVQLSTMPVAVCHGSGPDQAAANHNAARNALEYLKLMTKRSIGTNAPKDRAATPNKGSSAKKANGK